MLRSVVSSMILVAAPILAAGCVDGDPSSVFIVGNGTLDDECIVQDDPLLSSGTMDTAVARDYELSLIVRNQILARPGPSTTDPNGVNFTRAEIELQDVTGASLAGTSGYSVPASGFIPSAEDNEQAGQGSVFVPAVPSSVRTGLQGSGRAAIHLVVTLFGETNGQLDVATEQWRYVVEICDGCLACFNVADSDGGSCKPGQDGHGYRTSDCPSTM